MQRAEKILPGHWSLFLCQVFEGREQCKGRGNTSVVISASQVPSLASRTKLGAVISGKFSQTHTVLSGFHMLFHVTLTTTLWIGFIVNPHFADEKTEAEEGWGIYRSGWLQNPTPGLPDCGLHAFNPLYSPLCFPGGPVAKSLPASAEDARDVGSIPGSGVSSVGGNGNLLQYSCLENSMVRRTW